MKRLACHCRKYAGCKLCQGAGYYEYEPGPAGWQPFRCPNCEGSRTIVDPAKAGEKLVCPTCKGEGTVDPANPAAGTGFWDKMMKIFFGA